MADVSTHLTMSATSFARSSESRTNDCPWAKTRAGGERRRVCECESEAYCLLLLYGLLAGLVTLTLF